MNHQIAILKVRILDGTEHGLEATFPSETATNAFYSLDPSQDVNWIDLIATLSVELLSSCIDNAEAYATVKAWCVADFAELVDSEMSAIAEAAPLNLNTEK